MLYGPSLSTTTGLMTVSFAGQTALVDVQADATAMRTALMQLSLMKDISVTLQKTLVGSDTVYRWDVTFNALPQPIPLLSVTRLPTTAIFSQVTRQQQGTSPAPAGDFALTLGAETTSRLPWNASAAAIKAALQGLSAVKVAIVVQETASSLDVSSWLITFPPVNGDVPLLVAQTQSASLSGTFGDRQSTLSSGFSILVNGITDAVPLSGSFQVSSITTGQLVSLPVSADCVALTAIVGGQSCSFLSPGLSGERKWTVDYTAGYVAPFPITVSKIGMVGLTPDVQVVKTQAGAVDEVQEIALALSAVPEIHQIRISERGNLWEIQSISLLTDNSATRRGFFQVQYQGRSTTPMAPTTSASDMRDAIAAVYRESDITVSQTAVSQGATLTGFRWDVTFYAATDVAPMTAVSNLTEPAGVMLTVSETRKGRIAAVQNVTMVVPAYGSLAGTFSLQFGGQVSSPLPFIADAVAMQQALEQLSTVDRVNVTLVSPNTEGGRTWIITFPFIAGDVAPLGVVNMVSLGSVTPSFRVVQVDRGRITPVAGQFAVKYNSGQTPAIPLSATVTQIQTALLTLPGLSTMTIQVSLSGTDLMGGRAWDITFVSSNPIELVTVDTTGVTGDAPFAQSVRRQAGTTTEIQRIETRSAGNGVLSGTFFLAYGGSTTPALSFSCTAVQMEAALNALPTIGVVSVSRIAGTSATAFIWLVTFTAPAVDSDPPLLFAGGAQQTLRSTTNDATITVTEVAKGSLSPVSGNFTLALDQSRVIIPANASASAVSRTLQSVARVKQVTVTRSPVGPGAYGVFVWRVTFSGGGDVSQLTVADTSNLGSSGRVTVAVTTIKNGSLACCSKDTDRFHVAFGPINVALPGTLTVEQNWQIVQTSVDLTGELSRGDVIRIGSTTYKVDKFLPFTPTALPLDTPFLGSNQASVVGYRQPRAGPLSPLASIDTITSELLSLLVASQPNATVTLASTAANGDRTWRITMPLANPWGLLRGNGAPGVIPTRIQAVTALVQSRLEPEVRLLYVNGSAPISGSLRFTLDGANFQSVPWNASEAQMKQALEAPGFFETVNVERRRLDFTSAPFGDGFGWLVTFVSEAGGARSITFDTSSVSRFHRNDVSAGSLLVKASESSKIGGTFQLVLNDRRTGDIRWDATASDIQAALQSVTDVGIFQVTRSSMDPNGGFSWSITFMPSAPSHRMRRLLEVDTSKLAGTSATARVVIRQRGSTLSGTFRLGFDGSFSAPIAVSSSVEEVEQALELLPAIGDVRVGQVAGRPRAAWSVEFVSVDGEVTLLAVDATGIVGADSAVTVTRVQRGVGIWNGTFSLGFDGQQTAQLPIDVSENDIRLALAFSTRARVLDVTKRETTLSGVLTRSWDVIFEPSLHTFAACDDVPLLAVDATHLVGVNLQTDVRRVSSPCVAVRVFINDQDAVNGELRFAYVRLPHVSSIWPTRGSTLGGTTVTLKGRDFLAGPSVSCVFGTVEVPAVYFNSTTMKCQTPPLESPTTVFVSIKVWTTSSPSEYILSTTNAAFVGLAPVEIRGISPSHGFNTGGTRVQVSGSGFVPSPTDLLCRFSISFHDTSSPLEVTFPARFHSAEMITCVSPSLTQAFASSDVVNWWRTAQATAGISVSVNGVDFSPAPKLRFWFKPPTQVQYINPVRGPLRGGTSVRVTLADSSAPSARNVTHCRFGNQGSGVIVPVSAAESDMIVRCVTPSHVLRPSVLQVVVNSSSVNAEVQVVQTFALPGSSVGGFFILALGATQTRPIRSNAAATGTLGDSMAELVSELPGVVITSVTRSAPDPQGGYAWSITFSRACGDLPQLTADGLLLSGDDNGVTVVTISDGPSTPIVSELQRLQITQTNLKNPQIVLRLPVSSVVKEVQRVSIGSNQDITGSFLLSYLGFSTLPLAWDSSAAALGEALYTLPGIGAISVSRNRTASQLGYTWDITFDSSVVARPLVVLSTATLTSASTISSSVSRVITGTTSLGGSFVLKLSAANGGNTTTAIAFDASADVVKAALINQLGLAPVDVKKVVSSTEIQWIATFAIFNTQASGLLVASNTLTGTTGLIVADNTAQGAPLTGSFALTLQGKRTTDLAITSSASSIQSALQLIGLPETVGVSVTKRLLPTTGIELELRFPDSAGNVAAVIVDGTKLSGPGLTTKTIEVQDGNFAPLGGSFTLSTVAARSTAPLPLTVSVATLKTEIETLLSTKLASIQSMTLSTGFGWLLTFSSAVDRDSLLNLRGQSALTGTSSGVYVSVLKFGNGPVVPVSVSTNGQDFYIPSPSVTPLFTYILPFEVTTFQPQSGPVTGNTPIIFTLSLPIDTSATVFCRFETVIVRGFILSATTAQCVTPLQEKPLLARVDLSLNAVDFDVYAGRFEFVPDTSSRFQLVPSFGFVGGGTLVHVMGPVNSFDPLKIYTCKFGGLIVTAEAVNTTHVSCRSPPAPPGDAAVRISHNGIDYSAFNLSYKYEDPLFVTRIFPVGGDIEGGDTIDVYGGNFAVMERSRWRGSVGSAGRSLMCRFGDVVVDATIVSPTNARCVVPPLQLIPEVQRITVASRPFVQAMQRVTIRADPLVPTVQELRLRADPIQQEVQEFRVFGDPIAEVQRVTVISQAFGGETFSIRTRITSLVREIQVIRFTATTFIGGSFALQMDGRTSTVLASYATSVEVQDALQALPNIGSVIVTKSTQGGTGSCFWQIEFVDRVGDVPMLLVRNISLMDSGSQDLKVEVLELVKGQGSPLAGSFQLVVDGKTSDLIPFDATEAEMRRALTAAGVSQVSVSASRLDPVANKAFQWLLTLPGLPDRTRSITAITGQLAGGRGVVDISTVSPGGKSEQQQIVTSRSSGTFTCSIGSSISLPIAFDATPAAVGAAFNASIFGRVSVKSSAANSWLLTFLDWAGNVPMLDCGIDQTVTEVTRGTSSPLGGTFRLGVGDLWTPPLRINASAAQIEAALESLSGIGDLTVTMPPSLSFSGAATWDITFPTNAGNVQLLRVDNGALIGESPQVTVVETQPGNQVSGRVRISSGAISTPPFAVDTPQATLLSIFQQSLPGVASITSGNVLDARGLLLRITFLSSAGNVQLLNLSAEPGLSGQGIKLQSKTITDGTPPIGGTFRLSYGGFTTPPLAFNVSAEEMQETLRYLKSLPYVDGSLLQVRRSGPDAPSGGMTWRVTFPFGLKSPSELLVPIFAGTLVGPKAVVSASLREHRNRATRWLCSAELQGSNNCQCNLCTIVRCCSRGGARDSVFDSGCLCASATTGPKHSRLGCHLLVIKGQHRDGFVRSRSDTTRRAGSRWR
ncbi:hypothetical protein PINS_up014132 [Pythium insidiosum]|nr:hypothetical protein PINS_up014132 [Pythium insidiosum]